MQTVKAIKEAIAIIKNQKKQGRTIGFVPTMGALHKGHISLIDESKKSCDFTVVSVFVNPIQFGPNEDFNKYPRPLENDIKLSEQAGADLLFAPGVEEMLGSEMLAFVDINKMQDNLCGAKRPGHFRGVCTIVSKFFNIVAPDRAFFGKKDIQQLYIIKKMVQDLNFDIEIVPCPTYRENDGLAMSSRNIYLSHNERQDALILYKTLKEASRLVDNGESNAVKIIDKMIANISEVKTARIDYVKIVNEKMEDVEKVEKGNIIALAVFFGKTRLIDNFIAGENL